MRRAGQGDAAEPARCTWWSSKPVPPGQRRARTPPACGRRPAPPAGDGRRHAHRRRWSRSCAAKEEYLQTTHEELETSNEELKSSNEEMQSVNEELQSTNEELETSKEELQSVNEELATVNTELQTKVADLSRANNDMNNLLAGTGIATVFVDHAAAHPALHARRHRRSST